MILFILWIAHIICIAYCCNKTAPVYYVLMQKGKLNQKMEGRVGAA